MNTTIRIGELQLVLAAEKLRRWNHGRTTRFAALSQVPVISLDCHNERSKGAEYREDARRYGLSPTRMLPMERGHIAMLYERVQTEHGGAEVRKTWGCGIRALRQEPRHVLAARPGDRCDTH